MLRIFLSIGFLVAFVEAGLLELVRERRSPGDAPPVDYLKEKMMANAPSSGNEDLKDIAKPYMEFAERESGIVNDHTGNNWNKKMDVAGAIQGAGERARLQGESNFKKVDSENLKAVEKHLKPDVVAGVDTDNVKPVDKSLTQGRADSDNLKAVGKQLTQGETTQALRDDIPMCRGANNEIYYAAPISAGYIRDSIRQQK